jgi:hypothetical protein
MPFLLIVGGILILGGLALFVFWFGQFLLVLKAFLPLIVMSLGGLLAYFGWEERRDSQRAFLDFSSPDEASRYQAEALAYQEKLDSLVDRKDTESQPEGLAGQAERPRPSQGPSGDADDGPEAGLGNSAG